MLTKTTCKDPECNRCPNACCSHHAHGGSDEACDGDTPSVQKLMQAIPLPQKERGARPKLPKFVQDALSRLDYTNDD